MKDENAKEREGRRQDRANALVAQHSLPASMVELLAKLPADEQAAKAETLVKELGLTPGTTPPNTPQGGATPPPAPVEGAPAAEPAIDHMVTGGTAPVVQSADAPAGDWQARLDQAMKDLPPGDWEGLKAVQDSFQKELRAAEE